jgi:16S rRNA C967 or C1407 C5-methylase (RsmB/RsmF family)/NOL1/NOP2/fmu family ribosome biogenesis protein
MESLPAAFKENMQAQLKGDYELFIDALQKVSPTSIRLNPKKTAQPSGIPVPWASKGLYLSERPVFTLDPVFHGGAYYVQEASSMFLEWALKKTVDLAAPIKVLDLCAAPGGKSTHILSLLNDQSLLVSNEVIRSRASILSENIQKWGYPNSVVTNNDPEDFSALENFFDVIVVDAPCSGEGLFRKDPMAVNQWSEENVDLCAARQKRIIHDVWPSLRQDGILIYCTCTYNEKENENNLAYFSNEYDVEFIDLQPDPSWNITKVIHDQVIGYKFLPHRVTGEGFFISVMRKKNGSDGHRIKIKKKLIPASSKITERLSPWILESNQHAFIQHSELVFAFPAAYYHAFEILLQQLKIVYAGTNLATFKHDKPIPEHALAVSTIVNRDHFPIANLEKEEALRYLRRETIQLPNEAKGFTLISYNDIILGWVNALQNRSNNLYPQEWRIRMAQF